MIQTELKPYIDKKEIVLAYLNKDNTDKYAEQINKFVAKRERYTKVLKETYKELASDNILSDIDEHKQYRNTTILLINQTTNDIICFCSYNCSHVRLNAEYLLPAIEIETFAMHKDYSGFMYVKDGMRLYRCSDYAIQFCINRFELIKKEHIYASLVRVHSDTNSNVVNFYKRNNFESFPSGWRFFKKRNR